MSDPILRDLWKAKDDLAKECGYDLRLLFQRLKAAQESGRRTVVNRARSRSHSSGAR